MMMSLRTAVRDAGAVRLPRIEVKNAQRAVFLNLRALQSFAEVAIELAWRRRRGRSGSIPEVFVIIVSDERMTRLHKEFCAIAEPTDVLSFHHGEIVISAQTAARQARVFRSSLQHELRLYLLHGLLHLCGYSDTTSRSRATMHRLQHILLKLAEGSRQFEPGLSRVNLRNELATSRRRSNQRRSDGRRNRAHR